MTVQWAVVIEIDSGSVRKFAETNTRVVLAMPCGPVGPHVIWNALEAAPSTTVVGLEAFGLYASQSGVADGALLHVQSEMPAVESAIVYQFQRRAFSWDHPPRRVPAGHYGVTNLEVHAQTFGLLQGGTVNGQYFRAPINAVVLPREMTADFVPSSAVYLWTQRRAQRGTIMVEMPGNATVVSFVPDVRERAVHFDPATARFVPSDAAE